MTSSEVELLLRFEIAAVQAWRARARCGTDGVCGPRTGYVWKCSVHYGVPDDAVQRLEEVRSELLERLAAQPPAGLDVAD